jgi:putative PEP-CTERM system TPR-repeat lipoprotein
MTKNEILKRLSAGCAVVVLATSMTGMPINVAEAAVSEKSVRYFEKAQSYTEKGDINSAVIELKNAIRTDGENVDARFQLAVIYLAQGDAAGAEKELRAAMSRGYDENKVIPLLAQAYILQGRQKELIEDFGTSSLEGEAQGVLSVRRAQAYLMLKQIDNVKNELERAKGASPDLAEIYVVESWVLQGENDLEGAEAAVDIGLSKSDKSQEAFMQKAELRRLQNDLDAAVEFATKALEINPYRREARVTRGLALAGLNEVEKALEDAETLIERNANDPFAAFLKGWGLSRNGDSEAGLAALAEGQGIDSFVPALYLSAELHLRSGQLEQARAKIEKFLMRSPGSRRGILTSAAIYYQAGDFDAAVDILEPLYEQNKEDSALVSLLAYAYEQAGEPARAAALFDKASELAPEIEELQFRSAQAKINSGDVESGMEDLAGLVDSTSSGKRAATSLFLTQLRAKDFDAAAKSLDNLVEIGGSTPATDNFRASLALTAGDIVTAEKYLKSAIEKDDKFTAARINLARLLRTKKDSEGAKLEYERLLQKTPGYLPAINGLIELARDVGDTGEVSRLYDQGVKQNPESERAHGQRINYLLGTEQFDRAMVAARAFTNALPESSASLDALGRSQAASGEMASAVVTYRQLTNQLPGNATAHYRLAQALIKNESFTDAMFALDRVLALDPTFERARRARIAIEKQVRGNEGARSLARQLYNQAPEEEDIRKGLGEVLIELDRKEEGVELLEKAFVDTQARENLISLYLAYDKVGRSDDATKVLVDWLGKNPEEPAVEIVLFSRYITLGKYDNALKHGEALYEDNPDDVVVLNNLAWLYEKKGRIDEAKVLAKTAHEKAPRAGEIGDTYGWILFAHGDPIEAEAVLADAALRSPTRRDIQYHHAAALAKIGKTSEAIKKLKMILGQDGYFDGRDDAANLMGELE